MKLFYFFILVALILFNFKFNWAMDKSCSQKYKLLLNQHNIQKTISIINKKNTKLKLLLPEYKNKLLTASVEDLGKIIISIIVTWGYFENQVNLLRKYLGSSFTRLDNETFEQVKELIIIALERGADINYIGISRVTALEESIKNNSLEMVKFLINIGAKSERSLAMAVMGESPDMVKLIIAQGAKVNKEAANVFIRRVISQINFFNKFYKNNDEDVLENCLDKEKLGCKTIRKLLRISNTDETKLKSLLYYNRENYGLSEIDKVLVDAIVKEKEYEKAVKAGIQAPTLSFGQHIPKELADYIYVLTKQ